MDKENRLYKGAVVISNKNLQERLSRNIDDYPNGVVLIIDKPYGWSSADVVRKLKFSLQRWFGTRNIKVGHAGTLDPLATGVLLVCLGRATKLADSLQAEKKGYIAEFTFGATTPSYDLEKEIDATYPHSHITKELIEEKLPLFIGAIEQLPPIFSAKLIDGQRAYTLARAGEKAKMKPSLITIYNITIITWESPKLTLSVECSKGTYIRSLARDFGAILESGAHLTALVRNFSGDFTLSDSISLEKMKPFLELYV